MLLPGRRFWRRIIAIARAQHLSGCLTTNKTAPGGYTTNFHATAMSSQAYADHSTRFDASEYRIRRQRDTRFNANAQHKSPSSLTKQRDTATRRIWC